MRLFKEFQCRFLDDEGDLTGQKKYSFGRMKIDLLTIVAYNECTNSLTTVYLSTGDVFTIKIDYDDLISL